MLVRSIVAVGLVTLLGLPSRGNDAERAGPDWWSLQPLAAPPLPPVGKVDWVSNPVDHFVLNKLEAKNLLPSPPASREALIRRVTFDLLGLPPSPAEIDAFVQDRSPTAYLRLVERLLASPQYGERWARHWLDAARYSESHGFEYDRIRDHAWRYRDYVIRSFNEDRPYARFVREQLAGDILPNADSDGVVATGFLVAGPHDQAGNISASQLLRAKAREDELEDMLGAVGQTFLGMTVNCARCHNHKFDPIPAKDYYRMKAVFEGVFPGDRTLLPDEEVRRQQQTLVRWERERREAETKLRKIETEGQRAVLQGRRPNTAEPSLPQPASRWTFEGHTRDIAGHLDAELKDGAVLRNGRLVLDGKGAHAVTSPLDTEAGEKTFEAWVVLPNLDSRGGGIITLQSKGGSPFDSLVYGERQPRKWVAGSESFQRTRDLDAPAETSKVDEAVHVAVSYSADNRIQFYRNGRPYGAAYTPVGPQGKLHRFPAKESVFLFGLRHTGGVNAPFQGEIDEARFYDRALDPKEVLASFEAGPQRVSRAEILAALSEEARREHAELTERLKEIEARRPTFPNSELTYASKARQPTVTHLLHRGDVEQKRDEMTPGALSVIKSPKGEFELAVDSPESVRRIRFADWVVSEANPLTWRVMANRVWQHHFGEGIVRSPNDFGFNGEKPTHRELLDHLARELIRSGGSVKHLHRLILLSSTYQQAALPNPEAAKVDADNRLLWRYPLRRLEAEVIRDTLLALGDRLNLQAGGPGFRPFRIENFNSSFYVLQDDDKPELNRRSIYRINVNSAKDPLLDSFDCPDPAVKTPRRSNTTTPLQALSMMNGNFTQRSAQRFADRLRKEVGTIPEQVALSYRLAFGRSPSKVEADRAVKFVGEQGLREFCWALLNSNELLYLR